MALIRCRECNKEISDEADRCPNCGCINNKSNSLKMSLKGTIKSQYNRIYGIMMLVLSIIIGIMMLSLNCCQIFLLIAPITSIIGSILILLGSMKGKNETNNV